MGEDSDWQGSGRVMGQDGKLIFIRHGRNYIVASPSRVMKTKPDFELQQVTGQNDEIPNKQENSNSQPNFSDRFRQAKFPANSTQSTPPPSPLNQESDSESDQEFFEAETDLHIN